MRIVTFCAHQPYLHLFAGLNLQMDVVQLENNRRFLQNWNPDLRPLPSSWNLITWDQARINLAAGHYQLALAHNVTDYIDFLPFKLPCVLVFHTSLSGRLSEEHSDIDPKAYRAQLRELLTRSKGQAVFISESKRRDWGLAGLVIPLAIDTQAYQGYTGEDPVILRVANQLIERGEMLGYTAWQTLIAGLNSRLVGYNPRSPEARPARDWEELKQQYRCSRVYLHTASPALEDGYNLAMLEAMATGMPVVCTASPTAPVIDGENGFISQDLAYLRSRLELLLADRDLARNMGMAARKTVQTRFSMDQFKANWERVFQKLT